MHAPVLFHSSNTWHSGSVGCRSPMITLDIFQNGVSSVRWQKGVHGNWSITVTGHTRCVILLLELWKQIHCSLPVTHQVTYPSRREHTHPHALSLCTAFSLCENQSNKITAGTADQLLIFVPVYASLNW